MNLLKIKIDVNEGKFGEPVEVWGRQSDRGTVWWGRWPVDEEPEQRASRVAGQQESRLPESSSSSSSLLPARRSSLGLQTTK